MSTIESMAPLLLLLAAQVAASPRPKPPRDAAVSEDVTVKAKAAAPALAVPPPAPAKPVVDEVLDSLSLGRGAKEEVRRVAVAPDAARLQRPYPKPPYLALSPAHIEAQYDAWTFEVLSGADVVYRAEGVGLLRERLEWDGDGGDGRPVLRPGGSYRYRFTGRRGGRSFVIDSEPVRIASCARRDYGGRRWEVALEELFPERGATLGTGADPYLKALASAFREGEPRPDGAYRLELLAAGPRGKAAEERADAVAERLARLIPARRADVKVELLPADGGETLAALVPEPEGPAIQAE